MRVAVAGGTGCVGRHLVAALERRDHEPVVIARSVGVDLVTGRGLDAALEGVDVDNDEFFPALRHIVCNWLRFFSTHPVERGFAYAAGNEVDVDAGAAVRSVTSAHFVSELTPLVKGADARGEFAPGTPVDQVVAMVVLLLRHLDKAPFYKHVDPILDLTDKRPAEVERIALELVDALERAYAAPRKRTKTRP